MVSDLSLSLVVTKSWRRLNPCSNGIWSLTKDRDGQYGGMIGLNPCSNGIWSLTMKMTTGMLSLIMS